MIILEWPECRWKEHGDFEKLQVKMLMEEDEIPSISPRVNDKNLESNKFVSFSQPKEEEKTIPEIKSIHVDTPVPKPLELPKEEEKVVVPKLDLEEFMPVEKKEDKIVGEEDLVIKEVIDSPKSVQEEQVEQEVVTDPVSDPPRDQEKVEPDVVKEIVAETPSDVVVVEKPKEMSPKMEPMQMEAKVEVKVQPETLSVKKEIAIPHRMSTDRGGSLKSPVSAAKRLSREINPREDELVRIVMERNELQVQLSKAHEEILHLKKTFSSLQETVKSGGNENEDEKYSLHMLLFVAIIFFLVGYALK